MQTGYLYKQTHTEQLVFCKQSDLAQRLKLNCGVNGNENRLDGVGNGKRHQKNVFAKFDSTGA